MSDYSPNLESYFDFKAYMANVQGSFHPGALDDMDFIGHGDFDFDEIMAGSQDFDFGVPEALSPIDHGTQPALVHADATTSDP
ncbi:hypothetical protein MGN70_012255 [Eutypa lata]|uniref:Uncharacterized protein n=1 Tax=Eutypa lata (strain UCR-EL1) TaxID=1287681 RepID=M7SZF7_EUTLA|nr:hypothetical protein UCREL1_3035 [Eutypa lata UCREL1]KAI1245365.1 hypothetical protein MGN70_012255 [Eutypa lata]